MKNVVIACRVLAFMTLLTGLVYPLFITGLGQAVFADAAGGSLIIRDGHIIGSYWIAQKFTQDKYFWPRPSSIDFNPLPSGGSNLSPASTQLKTQVDQRAAALQSGNGTAAIPQDLLFTSASGLDPHITPAAALYQAGRVAQARALPIAQVNGLIRRLVEDRQLGLLGEKRVNVLELNLALDRLGHEAP